ncbi:MmcQ/YjbR family DNA-binding protein [Jannaschia pohangensis]|uniref:Predicted DNA-binding protein, MmcQ/YjbR family n=1 Tax=Jannaschia pohangensis TaxID=390807 RepID=A0A1I3QK95_9RHOB|nr:MmcQ/YjbR family DNA-binding protein [Jannaschia pohangensis]SFJ33972.1 Predicted DNA-binding protein, MmcQ/YjbR family [Jannaschia pohangensis]
MTRADIDTICAALPGATPAGAGELDSWKVGGKMFACMAGGDTRGSEDGVSVKCPDVETATMLIDAGAARKAKYFHRSWVRLPYADTDRDEAEHRIRVSYDTVRASLPKATREAL